MGKRKHSSSNEKIEKKIRKLEKKLKRRRRRSSSTNSSGNLNVSADKNEVPPTIEPPEVANVEEPAIIPLDCEVLELLGEDPTNIQKYSDAIHIDIAT